MSYPTVKIEGEQQAVRLDETGNVDRLAVTVVEVNGGEVDSLGGHCMTDAAWLGGNSVKDTASGAGQNASCSILLMM
jgi:hypothetical protein